MVVDLGVYMYIDVVISSSHLKWIRWKRPRIEKYWYARVWVFLIKVCIPTWKGWQVYGREPGQFGPVLHVEAANVITCGGFYSDRLAKLNGGNYRANRIVTFRGTYYQLKSEYRTLVSRNIYPVPSGGGIPVGVHFTPTVSITPITCHVYRD